MNTVEAPHETRQLSVSSYDDLSVHFHDCPERLSQDEEWCVVKYDGVEKKIRFHDYDELYLIPGLYERLFYEKLKCNSPQTVCSLLKREIEDSSTKLSDLAVLDVGAGNGMVGEQLEEMGVDNIVGVDIVAEAVEALERDRPGLYKDYHVVDLTDVPQSIREQLENEDFNCMTTVAALGFGDIPPLAFAEAYNLISRPGWIAFNIKDRFITEHDTSGFSCLIRRMVDSRILDMQDCLHYRHRIALDGTPLYYFAIVAVKQADIPMEWFDEQD